MNYDNSEETRQAIIDACLHLQMEGINQGTSGNVSVRIGDEMLITPSGIPYKQMYPSDIVRVRLGDGAVRGLHRPSTEWRFHRDLLIARQDMQVVVHAHPVHCTALAMLREPIPACHYMIGLFGGSDVPVTEYAQYGSQALSDTVSATMKHRHGCLMANHGATVLGEDMQKALWRLGELEFLAQSYLVARAAGDVTILSDEEIADAIRAFSGYGP